MRSPIAAPRVLLFAAVLLVAFNLRGSIAVVAPLLPQIRADL
ncbi:MAG: MFS transporter, partial [Propionibacteriales bacterium]|nr:MFS transporter [Propionibacteriales bacterium]